MKTRMLKRLSTIALATAMAVTFIPVMDTVTNGTAGLVEAKAGAGWVPTAIG